MVPSHIYRTLTYLVVDNFFTDKLEASNCDVSLKETYDLLEHYEDKVPVKDIEISEHGLGKLL